MLAVIIFDSSMRLAWHYDMSEFSERMIGWAEVVTTVLFVLGLAIELYASASLASYVREHRYPRPLMPFARASGPSSG